MTCSKHLCPELVGEHSLSTYRVSLSGGSTSRSRGASELPGDLQAALGVRRPPAALAAACSGPPAEFHMGTEPKLCLSHHCSALDSTAVLCQRGCRHVPKKQ